MLLGLGGKNPSDFSRLSEALAGEPDGRGPQCFRSSWVPTIFGVLGSASSFREGAHPGHPVYHYMVPTRQVPRTKVPMGDCTGPGLQPERGAPTQLWAFCVALFAHVPNTGPSNMVQGGEECLWSRQPLAKSLCSSLDELLPGENFLGCLTSLCPVWASPHICLPQSNGAVSNG